MNPEGAQIYIQRAYAQILNKTVSEGVIFFDVLENYKAAIKDLQTAEEFDSEDKLQEKIDEAYIYADNYGEMINTLAPEDLHIDTKKKDRETCTSLDPVEYNKSQLTKIQGQTIACPAASYKT